MVSMTFESQEFHPQQQLRLPPKRELPSTLSTAPNTRPIGGSNANQGVQNAIPQLRTVSVTNKRAVRSAAPSKTSQNISKQTPAQASKAPGVQAKNTPLKNKGGTRDEKVKPSKGSGGIPNPTSEYLKASLFSPLQLREPQHLLVVVDLNGTLLFRPNRKNPTRFNMRPHAQNFLRYCVDTFRVVIWSSAKPENVTAMCNTILTPDIRDRVIAVWGRDKFNLTKQDFNLRVQCYKRLSKVWQDEVIAQSHPLYHEGLCWDQTNTVLIDDSREKARSEPYNLIEVPEWFGDLKEKDDILPQVHDYLNHLSMHSNVSACLKSRPWQPTVF